jgi:REP-associated tyrosine transposase
LHRGRKIIQPTGNAIREFYKFADELLTHTRHLFSGEEALLIANSLAGTIRERNYTCYACAVMPDHIHLLIRRHRDKAEEMIDLFQENSRKAMIEAGRRPVNHPVWGGPGWKVFLNTRQDMHRIVKYMRDNPIRAGLKEQRWGFVKEYDGWLPRRRRLR